MRIEDVATPEAFARDPGRVHAFYNARRRQLADPAIQPNAAHRALARLESTWPAPFLLVTQNVDDLHARAGSRKLLPMHGALRRARCLACGTATPWEGDLGVETPCPACGRPGGCGRTWCGSARCPRHMDEIEAALDGCGLFVSVGTSGQVYPAAGFVAAVQGQARNGGAEPGAERGHAPVRRRPITARRPKWCPGSWTRSWPGGRDARRGRVPGAGLHALRRTCRSARARSCG